MRKVLVALVGLALAASVGLAALGNHGSTSRAPAGDPNPPAAPGAHEAAGPAAGSRTRGPCGTRRGAPRRFRHVVWIVMENKSFSQIVGRGGAPYLTRLARRCGLAARFFAEAHPSLPNYIAMTSGSTQGIRDNRGPSAHPLAAPSIFSLLGADWRALQESMRTNCDRSSRDLYAARHNPAAYYTRIRLACQRQDVPLRRPIDLSARFTFITPNLCHDMHQCPGAATAADQIPNGDRWLARWMPRIVATREYRSGGTVVFITWDEDDNHSRQHIPTLVISPYTKRGTRSRRTFNHYSLLRTTQDLLGVRPYLGKAARARSMRSAFHL
jgi:hypothetical protein